MNKRIDQDDIRFAVPTAGDAAQPSRRGIIKAGVAALAFGAARLRWPIPAGAQQPASADDVCMLTPELTEGPYYLPLDLVRHDSTKGKPGLPLRLRVMVVDVADGCAPMPDAAVDIWHCDAQGYYSGVTGEPVGNANADGAGTEDETFLRGIQLTAADGAADFLTIYPGWYSGRTVHIHMKVHVGGLAENADTTCTSEIDAGTHEGGHVSHTGQIFFDDGVSEAVYASVEAYSGRDDSRRVRNTEDSILGDHLDEPGFLVALEPIGNDPMTDGFAGSITIGIDATATPDPIGGPGGRPDAGERPRRAPSGTFPNEPNGSPQTGADEGGPAWQMVVSPRRGASSSRRIVRCRRHDAREGARSARRTAFPMRRRGPSGTPTDGVSGLEPAPDRGSRGSECRIP